MKLQFRPVTPANWPDFEGLFECKGGPHYCWCMAWRVNEHKLSKPGKAGKKASMKRRVDEGVPIGLLAYHDDVPIAWCSVAPRETFRPLGGVEGIENVWSIACFFIKRPHRKQGLTLELVRAAAEYAIANGALHLEAYPVDPESPSYHFMGLTTLFEKARFEFVKKAGTRRNVMLLKLT